MCKRQMRRERRDDDGQASRTIHKPRRKIHSGRYAPKDPCALAVYAKRTEAVPLHQIRGGALCRRGNRQTTACEGLDYRILSAIQAVLDMASPISWKHFGLFGLFIAIHYFHLFRTPLCCGFTKFGSDLVGVDQLLCSGSLKKHRRKQRGEIAKAMSFIEMSRCRY